MRNIPGKADVVVIGGGPAGSTAANLLAHRGYDVVLLDQARHPRLMVGESILPHVWKYMDQVGAANDIEKAGFIRKSGGTGIWRGVIRQTRLADFGFTRPSLHVERGEFDEILLRVAQRRGVRAFEEVVVRQVHLDGGEKSVSYADRRSGEEGRITCRFIVDASGQGAVIANQLGFRQFDPDLRFMSVWGYYERQSNAGMDVIQELIDAFWNQPVAFAVMVHSRYTEDCIDMFAGRVYMAEPSPGLLAFRKLNGRIASNPAIVGA